MEHLPEAEPTPEEQLLALHTFIDTTTAAMATQLEHLQLMHQHPTLFRPERVSQLDAQFRLTVGENITALNDFFESGPRLQVVHDDLPRPAELVQFLGYDPENKVYGAGVITHDDMRLIWNVTSSSQIQLAPESALHFPSYH